MSYAVLIHGSIGSGKTRTCLSLIERLRLECIPFGGLISIRSYQDKELVGYDGMDVSSGEMKPLARLRIGVPDRGWFSFGELKYFFSLQGFNWANDVLMRTINCESAPRILFADEFGRLEKAGLGIYTGVMKVIENVGSGRMIIFTCRDDIIDVLEGILEDNIEGVYKFRPQECTSLWNTIQKHNALFSK